VQPGLSVEPWRGRWRLQGYEIVALARPASRRDHLADLPITWVQGDVTDRDSLRGKFDGADWLIHAAGMLGQAGVPESAYFELHEKGHEQRVG
jgi:uncharacterized protein YbjT (DUF2867 family)